MVRDLISDCAQQPDWLVGTYNHYETGSFATPVHNETVQLVVREEDASWIIVMILLRAVIIQFLKCLLLSLQLPPQITVKVAIFDDAFGQRSEINICILNTWDVSKPGSGGMTAD